MFSRGCNAARDRVGSTSSPRGTRVLTDWVGRRGRHFVQGGPGSDSSVDEFPRAGSSPGRSGGVADDQHRRGGGIRMGYEARCDHCDGEALPPAGSGIARFSRDDDGPRSPRHRVPSGSTQTGGGSLCIRYGYHLNQSGGGCVAETGSGEQEEGVGGEGGGGVRVQGVGETVEGALQKGGRGEGEGGRVGRRIEGSEARVAGRGADERCERRGEVGVGGGGATGRGRGIEERGGGAGGGPGGGEDEARKGVVGRGGADGGGG